MQTKTPNLTTATEILAAFNAVAEEVRLNQNPDSVELLSDLRQIFF